MKTGPFSFQLDGPAFIPSEYDNHIKRTLRAMKGQYLDQAAVDRLLAQGDPLLYEVYEFQRPEVAGELPHGVSVVHPGKVGDEYFMTKGHFHTVLETGEIYYGTIEEKGFRKPVVERDGTPQIIDNPRWGAR